MKMCAQPPFHFFTICEKRQLTKPTGFSLKPYSHPACRNPTLMSAPLASRCLRPARVLLRTARNHKVWGLGVLQWHNVQTQLCSHHTTGSEN